MCIIICIITTSTINATNAIITTNYECNKYNNYNNYNKYNNHNNYNTHTDHNACNEYNNIYKWFQWILMYYNINELKIKTFLISCKLFIKFG